MASFQIAVKPNRLAAGRFVNRVRRKLQEALVADQKRTGMTQSKIAALIGVHRSVISRELNGRQDITLGRVAELAWAMGREIEFEVRVPEVGAGQNAPVLGALANGSTIIRPSSVSLSISGSGRLVTDRIVKSNILSFEKTESDAGA